MWAKVFTLWFTFTTLLGQGLCCCSFAHVIPATHHVKPSTPEKTPEPSCPCCSHETSSQGVTDAPDAPHPHKSPCPCKDKKSQFDPALPDKAAGSDLLRSLSSWSDWLDGFCVTAEIAVAAHTAGDSRPPIVLYPSTARLHVLQVLRC